MKLVLSIILALTVVSAYAQRPSAFAKTDRIVTVEHWGRGEATVWAVQKDRVVIYKVYDTASPDELLAEIPIKKDQADKIRKTADAIPKEVRGRVHFPRGVFDGSMMRISFTSDGHFASDRIEIQNLWFFWLGDTVQAISEVMPEARKIRFKEMIEERIRALKWRADWPVESILIDDYYKAPNQTPEPTAPSGRGSP